MSDKDFIKELFSEKLGNYEAKVNPELWNSIASQIGTAGAAGTAATGLSLAAKWIIGVGIAGALTVTAVLVSNGSDEAKPEPAQVEDSQTTASVEEDSDAQAENVVPSTNDQQTNLPADMDEQPAAERTQPGGNPVREIPFDDMKLDVREYKPILVPSNPNDRVIQQIIHREKPVHTYDPVVKEPLMPEEIQEERHEVVNAQEKDFYVGKLPNIFTPNSDGENDHLKIESRNLTNFHIVVINAQNKVVYESRDPRFQWDGRDQSGQIVPKGNYVYHISADEFDVDKPRRYSPLLINY